MPAHHTKKRLLVVANARHSPSDVCALRPDQALVGALLGHAQKNAQPLSRGMQTGNHW
jgi:hypothetical protein